MPMRTMLSEMAAECARLPTDSVEVRHAKKPETEERVDKHFVPTDRVHMGISVCCTKRTEEEGTRFVLLSGTCLEAATECFARRSAYYPTAGTVAISLPIVKGESLCLNNVLMQHLGLEADFSAATTRRVREVNNHWKTTTGSQFLIVFQLTCSKQELDNLTTQDLAQFATEIGGFAKFCSHDLRATTVLVKSPVTRLTDLILEQFWPWCTVLHAMPLPESVFVKVFEDDLKDRHGSYLSILGTKPRQALRDWALKMGTSVYALSKTLAACPKNMPSYFNQYIANQVAKAAKQVDALSERDRAFLARVALAGPTGYTCAGESDLAAVRRLHGGRPADSHINTIDPCKHTYAIIQPVFAYVLCDGSRKKLASWLSEAGRIMNPQN
ncbi:hypothetical protein DIPPA_00432 [Diplonema papillatum]|nr:hypothetical protein DIPPA_13340 [Diplonema papillatum]KAJ9451150.1 hypothetical protein DIPPA_00432 [Diplonema papillatum]|eukprot:gene9670-15017_t